MDHKLACSATNKVRSLRQRGDVTVWLSHDVEAAWRAERRKTRGGQRVYSDLAIPVCLTLGMVYKQPLRQTEGFVRSLVKLMGLDLVTGEIVCSDLTTDGVGDPTALPELLDQLDGDVTRFIADGAYDGDPTSDLPTDRLGSAVEIIIPPPKTAVWSARADDNPTGRDQRITAIATGGRMAWQVSSGYNQRSRAVAQSRKWAVGKWSSAPN